MFSAKISILKRKSPKLNALGSQTKTDWNRLRHCGRRLMALLLGLNAIRWIAPRSNGEESVYAEESAITTLTGSPHYELHCRKFLLRSVQCERCERTVQIQRNPRSNQHVETFQRREATIEAMLASWDWYAKVEKWEENDFWNWLLKRGKRFCRPNRGVSALIFEHIWILKQAAALNKQQNNQIVRVI